MCHIWLGDTGKGRQYRCIHVHVCGEGLIEDVREQHACLSVRPQLSSRLESVCNFALQLESEVEAGQKAHTQLEEQYEMLTQVSDLFHMHTLH